MLELIEGYYAFFFLILLFLIGLYGMMIKRNLMKKIFGMSSVHCPEFGHSLLDYQRL